MSGAAVALTAAFVTLLPFGWSILPWNMQLGDLLFPFLAVAAVAAGWRTRLHRLDIFVAAYLLGSLASAPASLSPHTSWLALAKEAYVAGIYIVTALAAGAIGAERLCRWLTRSVVVLCALSLAAVAVFYVTGLSWKPLGIPATLPYVGTVFRVSGLLTGPELFGNLLTFIVPMVLLDAKKRRNAPGNIAAACLVVIAELLTFSLTFGGFAVAWIMALWPAWKHRPIGRAALAAAAVALVIAINVAAIVAFREVDVSFGKNPNLAPLPFGYVRQNEPNGADMVDVKLSYYPMSYYVIKKIEWSAFLERPLTGIGLAAFPYEAERAYEDGRLYSPYQHVEAHSTPFGRLAETGLVGTLPLLALVAAFIVYARRAAKLPAPDGAVAWALAAGCAGLLVNSVNVDMMNFRFLWFGAGVVRALTVPRPDA